MNIETNKAKQPFPLEFNLIYILLGTFTLPVIFLMIYVENIKGKPGKLFE